MHSLALARRDPSLRAFYAACTHVFIDGLPLIWLGRVHGHGLRACHRNTAVDWFPELCRILSHARLRVAYVGSRPGVWERGFAEIRRVHHPDAPLPVMGHHGYFDHDPASVASTDLAHAIARFAPDLLIVGMGMPIQERWVLANRHRLGAGCILTVGACLDYFAGEIATPPRWSGGLGLEWLFRLLNEPGRLGRRYLLEPWALLPAICRDLGRPPTSRVSRTAPPAWPG